MRFSYLASAECTDIGRKRRNNEDAVLRMPGAGIFCVADGMGGVEDGEVASAAVVDMLKEAFSGVPRDGFTFEKSKDLVCEAAGSANHWIKSRSEKLGKRGSGSTIVLLAFDNADPTRAAVLHAGDSRAYRFRNDELKRLSSDHSVAAEAGFGDEKDLGPMFRSLVTRAVGVMPELELEETPADVQKGDIFLLCSDGLTGMVADDELQELLRKNTYLQPEQLAQLLVNEANMAGGHDNVTVVIIKTGELPMRAAAAASDETVAEEARTEDPDDAILEPDTEEPSPSDSSEPPMAVDDIEGATPSDADAPVNVVRRPAEQTHRTGISGPMYDEKHRRALVDRAVTTFVVCVILLGIGMFLWKRHRDRKKEPTRLDGSVSELVDPAVAGSFDIGDDDGEELSEKKVVGMRRMLPTLIDGALEAGTWGYIEDHLNQFSDRIDDYLKNSGRAMVYMRWLSLWKKISEDQIDPAESYLQYARETRKLCDAMQAEPPEMPENVSWDLAPVARADQYCKLLYGLQKHLMGQLRELVSAGKQEAAVLGANPEETLSGLWFFVGDANERTLAACGPRLDGIAVDVERLETWLTTCGESPVPAASVKMAPGKIVPKLHERVSEHRAIVSKQLALVPSRVSFWLELGKPDLEKRLNRIGQMHVEIFGEEPVNYAELSGDAMKQRTLAALFAEISGAAAVVEETDTP